MGSQWGRNRPSFAGCRTGPDFHNYYLVTALLHLIYSFAWNVSHMTIGLFCELLKLSYLGQNYWSILLFNISIRVSYAVWVNWVVSTVPVSLHFRVKRRLIKLRVSTCKWRQCKCLSAVEDGISVALRQATSDICSTLPVEAFLALGNGDHHTSLHSGSFLTHVACPGANGVWYKIGGVALLPPGLIRLGLRSFHKRLVDAGAQPC